MMDGETSNGCTCRQTKHQC